MKITEFSFLPVTEDFWPIFKIYFGQISCLSFTWSYHTRQIQYPAGTDYRYTVNRQRSSLLLGKYERCTSRLAARKILRKVFRKIIHFGRAVVWFGENQMIIHFSEAFILPSVRSSIYPFLQIILVLNLWCGMEFCPPNSSYDLCLLFCLFLLL